MQSSQKPSKESPVTDNSRLDRLTCDKACSDSATAVCGRCSIPLCSDHRTEQRDPLFSAFSETFGAFLLAVGLVIVIPVAWTTVDPVTILEQEVISNQENLSIPADLGTTVLHSSVLLGLGMLFTMWIQSADRKTSARFLRRTRPERVLCEDCSADTQLPRLALYVIAALAGLLILFGAYLAWDGSGVGSLRISALGILIYIVRTDTVMFLGKLFE